jgi:hypothetical protein
MGIRMGWSSERMKRGERKDGSIAKHCGIRIASSWNYCPICGKEKEIEIIRWRD